MFADVFFIYSDYNLHKEDAGNITWRKRDFFLFLSFTTVSKVCQIMHLVWVGVQHDHDRFSHNDLVQCVTLMLLSQLLQKFNRFSFKHTLQVGKLLREFFFRSVRCGNLILRFVNMVTASKKCNGHKMSCSLRVINYGSLASDLLRTKNNLQKSHTFTPELKKNKPKLRRFSNNATHKTYILQ